MNSNDYNKFLAAIKAANENVDKKALAQIQKRLLTEFESNDNDVDYLIRQFRYHID